MGMAREWASDGGKWKQKWGCVKGKRYGRFFSIKKIYWEATVLSNRLGSTVATQPKYVKLG